MMKDNKELSDSIDIVIKYVDGNSELQKDLIQIKSRLNQLTSFQLILDKIDENTLEAWEDNLQGTKTVVILEDFNKSGDDSEEKAIITKYNGWLEKLQNLFGNKNETSKTLREINLMLYDALNALHSAHVEMDGKMHYPDKDRVWINDTLDIIEIKYLGHEPDGSDQEELAENGEPMLTDEEAYSELSCRLNNTRI